MKPIKFIFAALIAVFFAQVIAVKADISFSQSLGIVVLLAVIAPKKSGYAYMAVTPDLSALSTALEKWGGQMLRELVMKWNIRKGGVFVYQNVLKPIPLPKLTATGEPMPYREQDDTGGRGVKVEDRILTTYQSKYDWDFDPEALHNKYLNIPGMKVTFEKWAVEQIAKTYLSNVMKKTIYGGIRNGAGNGAVDICNGFQKIIQDCILASEVGGVTATGALSGLNAVEKIEALASDVTDEMKEQGFNILCSNKTVERYCQRFRALNTFKAERNEDGTYLLDTVNATLIAVPWIPSTSHALIATVPNNLTVGTNTEAIVNHASKRRNISENRSMLELGLEVADPRLLFTNDMI